MSIGRVELIDGNKQYREYTGGGNAKAESEYVYIERFIKTETLLSEWKLAAYEYTTISGKMYDSATGEYLGKRYNGENMYIVKYVPLSFSIIPYALIIETLYPVSTYVADSSFFSYLGIDVDLTQGVFKFTNKKGLSENPLLTWYKTYVRMSNTATVDDLKNSYPAILFRGFLKKLEPDDPMYIKTGTKTLNDAENILY